MINKLRLGLLACMLITILLTLSGVVYGAGEPPTGAEPIGDALDKLTQKDMLDFFTNASNVSQLIYVVMLIMVVIVLFNLIVFVYLVTSQNKTTKRMSDTQDKSTERFASALENSSKMQADAIERSAQLHQDALNKTSETLSIVSNEMSKSLNLLSQTISETNATLNAQYTLIEKLIDKVLQDMAGDHKALFDRFSEHDMHSSDHHADVIQLLNDILVKVNESLTWCKSRSTAYRTADRSTDTK